MLNVWHPVSSTTQVASALQDSHLVSSQGGNRRGTPVHRQTYTHGPALCLTKAGVQTAFTIGANPEVVTAGGSPGPTDGRAGELALGRTISDTCSSGEPWEQLPPSPGGVAAICPEGSRSTRPCLPHPLSPGGASWRRPYLSELRRPIFLFTAIGMFCQCAISHSSFLMSFC